MMDFIKSYFPETSGTSVVIAVIFLFIAFFTLKKYDFLGIDGSRLLFGQHQRSTVKDSFNISVKDGKGEGNHTVINDEINTQPNWTFDNAGNVKHDSSGNKNKTIVTRRVNKGGKAE